MCKNLMLIGIKDAKKAWQFVRAASKVMTNVDDDGFGYAALDQDGNLFGERWLNTAERFKQPAAETPFVKNYSQVLEVGAVDDYNRFGKGDGSKVVSILAHARLSTNKVCMENTHPFVNKEETLALIHNGVIHNALTTDMVKSSCDSEVILTKYIRERVSQNIEFIDDVTKTMRGYYAVGVLSSDGYVDIFKDTSANLVACEVPGIAAICIATSVDSVKEAWEKLKIKRQPKFAKWKSDFAGRFDAITGDLLNSCSFTEMTTYSGTSYYGDEGWTNYRSTGTNSGTDSNVKQLPDNTTKDEDEIVNAEIDETLKDMAYDWETNSWRERPISNGIVHSQYCKCDKCEKISDVLADKDDDTSKESVKWQGHHSDTVPHMDVVDMISKTGTHFSNRYKKHLM